MIAKISHFFLQKFSAKSGYSQLFTFLGELFTICRVCIRIQMNDLRMGVLITPKNPYSYSQIVDWQLFMLTAGSPWFHNILSSLKERAFFSESPRIIPGNRGNVRFIERIWLLTKRESVPSEEGVIMVSRREAYFTVGARMVHTVLCCECTQLDIGWRTQAWGHAKPAG